jgi:anti-sigma factor RsiW
VAGDDLIGPERRRVERHLVACCACRERLDSLREAVTVLNAAAAQAPIDAGAPSLWPALERQIRESRRSAPAWPRIPAWSWAAAGLAASLLMGVGVVLLRPHTGAAHFKVVVQQPRIRHTTVPAVQTDTSSAAPESGTESMATARREESPFRGGGATQPDPSADVQATH